MAEHECEPPFRIEDFPNLVPLHGVGARWTCKCGQVWIVRPYVLHAVRTRWEHESRRDARKRLGLHWWERLPRVSTVKPDTPPSGPSGMSAGPDGSR